MRDIRYQIAIDREPDPALSEEAAEIEVQQTIEGPTSFRIRFGIEICGEDLHLIEDERLMPGTPDREVTVMAFIDNEPHVLVHGIITDRQVSMAEGGPGSWLEIKGTDRRAVMNREKRTEAHSGTAAEVAQSIFDRYGFDADVGETSIQYAEETHTLNQAETDLEFIDKLAGQNGLRFWLDWDADTSPAGLQVTEVAHFKSSPPRTQDNPLGFSPPMLLAPETTPELKLNSGDGCSNVKSFELASNNEAPNQTGVIERANPETGSVEESEVTEPSDAPLGEDAPPATVRSRTIVTAGTIEEARVRNEAAVNEASWSVQATAEASVHALGGLITPHQIVKVTGGGRLNSGDYFVKAVAHAIDSSDHKLKIELLRNALGGS